MRVFALSIPNDPNSAGVSLLLGIEVRQNAPTYPL